MHSFAISSGFGVGVNTLEFIIQDNGGVSAFRAQLTGDARAQGVPEPGTLAIVALGLLAAGASRLRKAA